MFLDALEVRLVILRGMIELFIGFVTKLVNWIRETLEERKLKLLLKLSLSMFCAVFLLSSSSSFTPFQRTSLSHTHIYTRTYPHAHTFSIPKARKSYSGPMSRSRQIWFRALGLTVASFFDIIDYGPKIYQRDLEGTRR